MSEGEEKKNGGKHTKGKEGVGGGGEGEEGERVEKQNTPRERRNRRNGENGSTMKGGWQREDGVRKKGRLEERVRV